MLLSNRSRVQSWAVENVMDRRIWGGVVLKNCYAPWYLVFFVNPHQAKERSRDGGSVETVSQHKAGWYETARNLLRVASQSDKNFSSGFSGRFQAATQRFG